MSDGYIGRDKNFSPREIEVLLRNSVTKIAELEDKLRKTKLVFLELGERHGNAMRLEIMEILELGGINTQEEAL
jgi:hypothetical protein